jgi:hypothetical protein
LSDSEQLRFYARRHTVLDIGHTHSGVASGKNSHLDLAVANAASGNVSIYLGDGAGAFTLTSQPSVGFWPVSIVSADFNGDGHPDLATANLGSDNVSLSRSRLLGGRSPSPSNGPLDRPR